MERSNSLEKTNLDRSLKTKYTPSFTQNWKTAWGYLNLNLRAFLGLEFIAFIPILLTNILMDYFDFSQVPVYSYMLISFGGYFLTFLSQILIGCGYGLAYDILSSGNEFTEFGGFRLYFRNHWKNFILVSLLLTIVKIWGNNINEMIWYGIFESFANESTFLYQTLVITITSFTDYLWFCLFFTLYPSIIAKNKLKTALNENFHIIRIKMKEVMKYTVILYGFAVVIFLPFTLYLLYITNNLWYFIIGQNFWYYFIGLPMISLISTQMYNSIFLQEENPNDGK